MKQSNRTTNKIFGFFENLKLWKLCEPIAIISHQDVCNQANFLLMKNFIVAKFPLDPYVTHKLL
jgi:hypothetical protein